MNSAPPIVVLAGPPGAGKTTIASLLSRDLGIPRITTSVLLRADHSAAGGLATSATAAGRFAPTDHMVELLKARVAADDCANGFVLDGFPRTIEQVGIMKDMGIKPNLALVLDVPTDVAFGRLTGRLTHLDSGRVYHKSDNPPRVEGLDDITGEPLTLRSDDTPEAVTVRIDSYRQRTEPMVDMMIHLAEQGDRRHAVVSAAETPGIVYEQVMRTIDDRGLIRPALRKHDPVERGRSSSGVSR